MSATAAATTLRLILRWGDRAWAFHQSLDVPARLDATDTTGDAPGSILAELEASDAGTLASIDIEEAVDLFGGSSEAPRDQAIPVELHWPGLTDLLSDGPLDWADWRGELYVGGELLLAGRLEDPQWDEIGLSFSLALRLGEDAGTCLPPTWVVTTDHWAAVESADEGRTYPLVVGSPGVYTGPEGAIRAARGSPGIAVWASGGAPYYVVLAGHPVEAADVYIEDETAGQIDLVTVTTATDAQGQRVAVADISTQVASSGWTLADTYWVWWRTLPSRQGHPDITGAGDLLLHLLTRSSLPIDLPAWESVTSRANAYAISGYLDDPSLSPWAWVEAALLPLLPLTTTLEEGLLRPVWWEWLQPMTPTRALIEGENCSRVGPVRLAPQGGGIVNDLALSWACDASSGEYLRRRVLTGDPSRETLTDHWHLASVRQSWQRYGPRRLEMESAYIGDRQTADLILQRIAAARALPRATVEVEVCGEQLALGEAVALTLDPQLLPAGVVCLVTALRRQTGGITRATLVTQRAI